MDTITKTLMGICGAMLLVTIIIVILYFRSTPNKYMNKSKKKNEVDDEIEKELKKNKF